jgi:hypothetical protein
MSLTELESTVTRTAGAAPVPRNKVLGAAQRRHRPRSQRHHSRSSLSLAPETAARAARGPGTAGFLRGRPCSIHPGWEGAQSLRIPVYDARGRALGRPRHGRAASCSLPGTLGAAHLLSPIAATYTENPAVFYQLRLLVSLMFFGVAYLYKRQLFVVWLLGYSVVI